MNKELTDDELRELGRRYVIEKDLKVLSDLWKATRAEADATKEKLIEKLKSLDAEQPVNAREMAELLGVDQVTIRNWLGKMANANQRAKRAREKAVAEATATASEPPVDRGLLS